MAIYQLAWAQVLRRGRYDQAAPEHLRGRYMAIYQLSWALGQAVAPALFGFLFTENHALPWVILAGGCAACCLVLSTRLGALIQNDLG
jgi:MFS family permease